MKLPIRKYEFIRKNNLGGLGDVVAKFAEPIKEGLVKASPNSVAQYLKKCNCNKRKEKLNKLVTFT